MNQLCTSPKRCRWRRCATQIGGLVLVLNPGEAGAGAAVCLTSAKLVRSSAAGVGELLGRYERHLAGARGLAPRLTGPSALFHLTSRGAWWDQRWPPRDQAPAP